MYFGVFQKIKHMQFANLEEYELYQNYFAEFYDEITSDAQYDVDVYAKEAALVGAQSILELACGTGRVTMKLASKGYEMIGIDISEDMLSFLDNKLQKSRIRNRIKTVKADITDFKLKLKFKLVILPATTICLMKDDGEIDKLFNNIYEHMEEGGRFVFDYRVIGEIRNGVQYAPVISAWNKNDELKQVAIMQEKIDTEKGISLVNFYTELEKRGYNKRYLGYTVKRLITDEIIYRAVNNSKFKLLKIWNAEECGTEMIKFVELER